MIVRVLLDNYYGENAIRTFFYWRHVRQYTSHGAVPCIVLVEIYQIKLASQELVKLEPPK